MPTSIRQERPIRSAQALLEERLKKLGARASYIPDFGDMADYLLAKCTDGDMIIIMGAGDISSAVRLLLQ